MMSISLKWLCNKILIDNDWDVNVRDVNVAVCGIILYLDYIWTKRSFSLLVGNVAGCGVFTFIC
jgi:hypothetical protein